MTDRAPGPPLAGPERWIRPAVLHAAPYPERGTDGMLRLDAMENPYPLPESVRRAWLARLGDTELNRYPDSRGAALCAALRAYWQVPDALALLPGNGSDELIQLIHLAVGGESRRALAPEPTFGIYRQTAAAAGLTFVGVPLDAADYDLDPDAVVAAIRQHEPAVIWLPNPNNPTGRCYDPATIRRLAEAAPGLLVVDEAYLPYSRQGQLALCLEYAHLLVLRTLSKMGLAGLRIGVLIGQPVWLEPFGRIRLPYNIGTLNQVSAAILLEHADALSRQVESVRAARAELYRDLERIPGVRIWPSAANFFLIRVPSARDVYAGLRRRGILVRDLHGSHPLLAECLRVTVGTPDENRRLAAALNELLATA